MSQLSHNFLNLISTDISETIYWSEESIHDSETERCRMHDNSSSIISKSASLSSDNPPVLQSKYPILDSHNINTSILKDNPLNVIYLKNSLSEVSCVSKDNNINMYLDKWGGRRKE